MPQCLNRLQVDHPRAYKAHDGADFLALWLGIAVDRAVQATLLGFTKLTLVEPVAGVFKKFAAIGAGHRIPMVLVAVVPHHETECALFRFYTRHRCQDFRSSHVLQPLA